MKTTTRIYVLDDRNYLRQLDDWELVDLAHCRTASTELELVLAERLEALELLLAREVEEKHQLESRYHEED